MQAQTAATAAANIIDFFIITVWFYGFNWVDFFLPQLFVTQKQDMTPLMFVFGDFVIGRLP
jgi:hypothetical protein